MALKGHRYKTQRRRWAKRPRGRCRYGKLKNPRGGRICRRHPRRRSSSTAGSAGGGLLAWLFG